MLYYVWNKEAENRNQPFPPICFHTLRGVNVPPFFLKFIYFFNSLYLFIYLFTGHCKHFIFLHELPSCMNLYQAHTYMFSCVKCMAMEFEQFAPKQSECTITHPPCVPIKMAAAVIALHGGQKETRFHILIPLSKLIISDLKAVSWKTVLLTKCGWWDTWNLYVRMWSRIYALSRWEKLLLPVILANSSGFQGAVCRSNQACQPIMFGPQSNSKYW